MVFFTDSLFFNFDEYQKIQDSLIEKLKKERLDNYIYNIENPPKEIELSEEELKEQIILLESERLFIENKKLEIQEKINNIVRLKETLDLSIHDRKNLKDLKNG